jgi:hypothetical protein
MAKKLVIPRFSSETEDAAWHDSHKREIEQEFIRRMKAGTVIVPRRRNKQPVINETDLLPVRIRLSKGDIETARQLAAREGIGYQTYIRMVLREVLRLKANRK